MAKFDNDRDSGLSARCCGVSFLQMDAAPEKNECPALIREIRKKYRFSTGGLCFIYKCSSSQRTAQCVKQAEPIGQTFSLN